MANNGDPPWRQRSTHQRSSRTDSFNPRKRTADSQEAAWVADEDKFVLKQAKKKAEIRVKEGRAKPIDWLAVTLRFVDPQHNPFDDEVADSELDVVDPEGVLEGLDSQQLEELDRDLDMYITLEHNEYNIDFWKTMQIICKDRKNKTKETSRGGRGAETVTNDVDRLFNSKTLEELEALEKQIRTKLRSDGPIDVDYWEQLLHNLRSWKARAKMRKVSQAIIDSQMQGLRSQQADEASTVANTLISLLSKRSGAENGSSAIAPLDPERNGSGSPMDPEPLLKVRPEDKALTLEEETKFLTSIAHQRRKVLKMGYVPSQSQRSETVALGRGAESLPGNEGHSQTALSLYDREAARGVGEDEEIFTGEEDVSLATRPETGDRHQPRKPRYFNRVQMGYEWNKYNQTHYDYDNPPPKVVQGYKFNIFYPDLVDKTRAPTYKIERENGRKKGQSFAPAGQEDTCLIRFIAGPPYQDVAFRIVDKEWDYSAKRDRGFRSSFDRGVLQLHFGFKKIFYRK